MISMRMKKVIGFLLAGTMPLSFVLAAPAVAQDKPLELSPVPSHPIADGFTLATVGDLIYLRPMLATLEKQAPEIVRILRSADVTFGNFETTAIDLANFGGSPQAESGGTWMLADKHVPADLAAMGFDLVSQANNHVTDWGVEGMAETQTRLDDAGIITAGTGQTLASALAPRYVDIAKGRVGLVAATSSFKAMSRAADPLGEVPGRPGANILRTKRIALVDAAALPSLSKLARAKPGAPIVLDGVTYRATSEPTETGTIRYEVNLADEQANLRAIRQAKQNGNLAIFSLHNHEPGNWSEKPADFAIDVAHKMIDEGADMFIGHGPHQLRGIEIYKGRPIFYSLGNFAMMNNSLDTIPPDMYDQYGVEPGEGTVPEVLQARNGQRFSNSQLYESVIATSRFDRGRIAEIVLHPIDLGVDDTGARRGVPRVASPEVARRILERLQRLSAPFGTTIRIERGLGIVQLGATATK